MCPSIVVQTAKKTVVEFYFVFPLFFPLFIHCSRHTMGDDDDPMIHNDGMNVKNKKKVARFMEYIIIHRLPKKKHSHTHRHNEKKTKCSRVA